MRVVIAGGHGKIALLLERLLAERGDQAVGLIRNPAQSRMARQLVLIVRKTPGKQAALLLRHEFNQWGLPTSK